MTIQTEMYNNENIINDPGTLRRRRRRGGGEDATEQEDADLPSTKLPFVWKLYEMLEGVEKCGEDDIVSWVESGKAFKVHNHQKFLENVIPIYFKIKHYKSFQRQLNYYGFTRITHHGPSEGAYYHPKFIKDSKTLCLSIRSMSSKNNKKHHANNSENTSRISSSNSKTTTSSNNTTPKKKSSKKKNHNDDDTSWKIQLKLVLEKGADYALKEMDRRGKSSANSDEEEPSPRTDEDDFVLYDDSSCGDPVSVFDDMLFHTVV